MTTLDLRKLEPKFPSLRQCSKKGHKDGKETMPAVEWSSAAPFVEQLAKTAAARTEEIGRRMRQAQNQARARIAELTKSVPIYTERATRDKERFTAAEQRFDAARSLHQGIDPNKGPTTGGGLRIVSNFWYIFALIALGIGEFAITLKAFEKLLDEKSRIWEWKTTAEVADTEDAWVLPLRWNNFNEITEPMYMVINFEGVVPIFMTFAASALFIVYAHFLGIVLKRHTERITPQASWVIWAMIPLGIVVLIAATGLAYVRTTASEVVTQSSQLQSLLADPSGLSANALQYFVLFPTFLFIQLGLLLVATAISFGHYSSTRKAMVEASKELEKTKLAYARSEGQLEAILREIETEQQQGRHLHEEAISAVNHERRVYEMLAASYIDQNLRSRARQVSNDLAKVHYAEIPPPSWLQSWEYVSVTWQSGAAGNRE